MSASESPTTDIVSEVKRLLEDRKRLQHLVRQHNEMLTDVRACITRKIEEMASRSKDDEPSTPEDKAVFATLADIVNVMQKHLDGMSNGNN